jgi:hypothetical protein
VSTDAPFLLVEETRVAFPLQSITMKSFPSDSHSNPNSNSNTNTNANGFKHAKFWLCHPNSDTKNFVVGNHISLLKRV